MLNKSMEQMPDDTDDAESASFWNQILGSLEAGKVRDVSSESELKTLTDDLKSQLSDYWSGSELKNAEKLADEIAKGVSYT